MKTDQEPHARRISTALFCLFVGLLIGAWLILESSPKPCNPDDFTGCSTFGQAAVLGFLFLIPITIGLALILTLAYLRDLLRRR